MIEIEHHRERYLVVRISGTLTGNDYAAAIPELENAMELSGKPLRLMLRLEDFRGWTASGLWQDMLAEAKHHRDFERIAVVGESPAEKWNPSLANALVAGEVRYFERSDLDQARRWLSG